MNKRFCKAMRAISCRLAWGAGVSLLTFSAGWANPQGGEIVGGSGRIEMPDADTTLISQFSHNMAIDWTSFNVAASEQVIFQQPSASATALNRIFDQNPSQIFGAIDANGRVFLLNPNGIVFGPTAQVNLNSLIASSLDIPVEDFMQGNYNLQALSDREGGLVLNQGLIQAADGGSITLVGGAVANEGILVANYGSVNLAAGRRATLDFTGDGLMLFALEEGVLANDNGVAAAVSNSGDINASGGQVLLTAGAARNAFDSVVNNSGVIRANRIDNTGGVVRLVGEGGVVAHEGTIDVSGDTGGQVELSGDHVGLFGNARIDASGSNGGGAVYVGGGIRGQDASVANADRVFLGQDTVIDASATDHGDGGTVIVWGAESAQVYGTIAARGGEHGGDGGFVETSGMEYIDISRAPDIGVGGEWLIDPNNLAIVAGNGNTDIGDSDPFITTGDDATLGVELIAAALIGGASVTIETADGSTQAGDITWQGDAALDYNGTLGGVEPSLTLDADNDIIFETGALIFDSSEGDGDALNLTLLAPNDVLFDGATIDLGTGALAVNFGQGGVADMDGGVLTVAAGTVISAGSSSATGGPGMDTVILSSFVDFGGGIVAGASDDTFVIEAGFNGTLNGGGGDDSFDMRVLSGEINGGVGSDTLTLENYAAAVDVTLQGVGATGFLGDVFEVTRGTPNFDFFGIDEIIGSANAGDSLTGFFDGGVWTLSTDTYDAGGDLLTFSAFETLVGGTMVDTFEIDAVFGGALDGGQGDDEFFVSNGGSAGLIEGGDGSDDLYGDDLANDWIVDAAGGGTLNGATFTGIENLIGNTMVDTFDFRASGSMGSIDGDEGDDELTYALRGSAVDVTLDGAVAGSGFGGTATALSNDFSGIDTITGSGVVDDTLTGLDSVLTWTWTLGEDDANTYSTGAFTLDFSGMESLVGGTGDDTFDVNADPTVVSSIDGGAGLIADATDLLIYADIAASVMLTLESAGGDGFGGMDNLIGTFARIDNLVGSASDEDALTGLDDVAIWVVSAGTYAVGVDELAFSDFETLTGGSMADTFEIDADFAGALDGGEGNDLFDFDDDHTITTIAGGLGDDTADFADVPGAFEVDLSGDVYSANDIETFVGNDNANSKLLSGDGDDVWTIDALGGTVQLNGVGTVIDFSGFSNLEAGDGTDSLEGPDEDLTWTVLADGTLEVPFTADTSIDSIEQFIGGDGVDTFNIAFNYEGSLFGGGGDDIFNIDANLDGDLDGGVGNDIFNLNAGIVNGTLIGGEGDDRFNIGDGVAAMISGGDGLDMLYGNDGLNSWVIDALYGGTLNAGTVEFDIDPGLPPDPVNIDVGAFTGVEQLFGGTGDDEFAIGADGQIDSIDGGASDDGADGDTLTYADRGSDVAVTLTGVMAGTGYDGTGNGITDAFSGIDNLIGSAAADTLTGLDETATWTLLTGEYAAGGEELGFSDFESLVGGSGNDTFDVGTDTTAVSSVDGGDGGFDTLDGSGSVTLSLLDAQGAGGSAEGGDGSAAVEFERLEEFIATGAGRRLRGLDLESTWTLNASDANTYSIGAFELNFSGFRDLTGGSANDTFEIYDDPTVVESVDGGQGASATDRLTYVDFAGSVMLTLDAASDQGYGGMDDIIGEFSRIEELVGSAASSNDMLTGRDTVATWSLGAADENTYSSGTDFMLSFSGFEMLMGGSDADTFGLDEEPTVVGSVDGGDGTDSLGGPNQDLTWTVLADGTLEVPFMADTFIINSIEEFFGGNGVDTFEIGFNYEGDLDGGGGDDIFNLNAGIVNGTLIGGEGDDRFNIGDGVAAMISGGEGLDTLYGNDGLNSWVVDALYGGTLNAGTVEFDIDPGLPPDPVNIEVGAFTGVEQLVGGTGDDQFAIGADGQIDSIDGGASDDGDDGDTLTYADRGSEVAVTLTGAVADTGYDGTGSGVMVFAGIDNVVGSAGADTLAGLDETSTWTLNAADANTYSSGGVTLDFSGIERLAGGIGEDTFDVTADPTVVSDVDGGAGLSSMVTDTLLNPGSVALTSVNDEGWAGSALVDFSRIEAIAGGGAFRGLDADATWMLMAGDSNLYDALGYQLGFSGYESLVGGSADDTFEIDVDPTVVMSIDGGDGAGATDMLTYADIAGPVMLMLDAASDEGYGGTDNFVGTFARIDNLVGSVAANDMLTGRDAVATWTLGADDANTYLSGADFVLSFSGFEALTGGSDADTFGLDAAPTVVTSVDGGAGFSDTLIGLDAAATWILSDGVYESGGLMLSYSAFESLIGGAMSDDFVVDGDADFSATPMLTLDGGDGDDSLGTVSGTLTAAILRVIDIEAIGSAMQSLITAIDSFEFFGAGSVFIDEEDDIELAGDVADGLVVSAAGAITDSEALSVGGDTSLAAGGNITLDNAGNMFNGTFELTTSGNATVTAASDMTLLESTTGGTFSVATTGAMDISGALTADTDQNGAGDVSLSADGAIAQNGTLSGVSVTVVSGGTIDANAAITAAAGNVSLTAGGAINQGSNAAITAGGDAILVATGAVSQSAGIFATSVAVNAGAGFTSNQVIQATDTIDIDVTDGDLVLTRLDAQVVSAMATGGNIAISPNGDRNAGIVVAQDIELITTGQIEAGFTVRAQQPSGDRLKTQSANDGAVLPLSNFALIQGNQVDSSLFRAIAVGQAEGEEVAVVLDPTEFIEIPPEIVEPGLTLPCDQLEEEEARCQ